MQPWIPVFVALIAAASGIIVALIQVTRKENKRDHGYVRDALNRVSDAMDRVEGKVDSHIDWHLKEAGNGRATRRNTTRGRKAS